MQIIRHEIFREAGYKSIISLALIYHLNFELPGVIELVMKYSEVKELRLLG